jgi:hypothetical protein
MTNPKATVNQRAVAVGLEALKNSEWHLQMISTNIS